MSRLSRLRSLFILLVMLSSAGCAGPMGMHMSSNPPADLDYSATRTGDNGLFRATYTSATTPLAINELLTWTLHVETMEGAPVEGAIIGVSGDMPEHGHGMPTQPQVTAELGGGDYRVEGMQFQMGGWWIVIFAIDAGGVQDTVTFNLKL